ncbi:MAG: response regulator [Zoogloeaceae bacterium]|jgi:response regulator RpfG family c-di-GMP phosphodiesterase|nr:response regulator [Zoogloeaceae bacterium]
MEASTHPRTLLLVDDKADVLAALRRLLRPDGYKILTALGGAAGLDILKKQPVDVILSEQRMQHMSGVEFLSQARLVQPDCVRMALTGYLEIQSIAKTVNEGAIYKFLTKPWDDEQLRATLREAFVYKELADDNRRLAAELSRANQNLILANQRLQALLEEKQHQLARDEKVLDVLHEVMQILPLPLLGVDDSGMIATTNEAARQAFGDNGEVLLLGQQISALLPPESLRAADADKRERGSAFTAPNARAYTLFCRALGQHSAASGRLFIFIPDKATP